MKEKNGYNRYKEIFDKIKGECSLREQDELVMGPVVGPTEKTCKHYIMENGLHVYIRGEHTYISDNEVQLFVDGHGGEQQEQFFLSCDEESIDCIYHVGDGQSYSVVEYKNPEAEFGAELENRAYVPSSFGMHEATANISENVPADMGELISQHRGENTQPDAIAVYDRIIAMNEKLKEYERELETEETGKIKVSRIDSIKRLRERIDPLAQEVLQAEADMETLKAELANLRLELAEIDNDNISEMARKTQEVWQKIEEVDALEDEIKKIREEIKSMISEMQTLKEEAHAEIDTL